MIDILDPSGEATIQDLGRAGYRRLGVGAAGAMDAVALRLGNLLLDNPQNAAGVEIPGRPMKLRFLADLCFAITGADARATLAGRPLPADWRDVARAGEVLAFDYPRSGTFSYLTVAGGIDAPLRLGSRSTQLRGAFGGLDGRTLRPGDRLTAGASAADSHFREPHGVAPTEEALPLGAMPDGRTTFVRVLPAAEYPRYAAEAQDAFWTAAWKISPQSNRAGFRLIGPPLRTAAPIEMRSHGLVPGVIQVPADGLPIIQLADAYTAGGYPKIGVVIEPDLWRIARAPLGSALRFIRCDYAEALTAHDALEQYFTRMRIWARLHRDEADLRADNLSVSKSQAPT